MPADILVVEDEAIIATEISETLSEYGYFVSAVVGTGEEAVKALSSKKPDLVLMDIFLKGDMDGISSAKVMRKTSDTPIVFLTAHADEETLKKAIGTNPYGYVIKPFEAREIRTAIELALHRHKVARKEGAKAAAIAAPTEPDRFVFDMDVSDGKHKAIAAALSKVRAFSKVDPPDLERLAAACSLSTISSAEVIVSQGEENLSMFIVLSGRVALVKSSASGHELIVELLGPGDIFDFSLAFSDSPVTVRAQAESKLLWIPASAPNMIFDRYPEVYKEVAKELSERIRTTQEIARGLAHDSVEMRIAFMLSHLSKRFFEKNPSDGSLGIRMTRNELSSLVGTSPETAIRITKAMERQGLLDLSTPGHIRILDLEELKLMGGEMAA